MSTSIPESSVTAARRTLTGLTVVLGLLTLGLGIAVLVWPHVTLTVLAVLIAIQFFGFGIVQIIRAFADVEAGGSRTDPRGRIRRPGNTSGVPRAEEPLQTVVIIALVVGAWWVFRGVLEIVEGASGSVADRGLTIVLGVISVVAGGLRAPAARAVARGVRDRGRSVDGAVRHHHRHHR